MDQVNEYDARTKIIIIGDTGVGKSQLMARVKETELRPYQTTIGNDYATRTILLNNKKIKLMFWDMSGQDRFLTITSAYYRGAQVCIIMFNTSVKQSFENVAIWYDRFVKNNANHQKIICVGNNSNPDQRTVTEDCAKRLADHLGIHYMEVNTLSNENIDELFNNCAEIAPDDFSINRRLLIIKRTTRSEVAQQALESFKGLVNTTLRFTESGESDNSKLKSAFERLLELNSDVLDKLENLEYRVLQAFIYETFISYVHLIRDFISREFALFPAHTSPLLTCFKTFYLLCHTMKDILPDIKVKLHADFQTFIKVIYTQVSVNHLSYGIDLFCQSLIDSHEFELLALLIQSLIDLTPVNEDLIVFAVFLQSRFCFEQYGEIFESLSAFIIKLSDNMAYHSKVTQIILVHFKSITNSIDPRILNHARTRHSEGDELSIETNTSSIIPALLFLTEDNSVFTLLTKDSSIAKLCFITLSNYLAARSRQSRGRDPLNDHDYSICNILSHTLPHIELELAMEELVYWTKNLDSNREFSQIVLSQWQNFLSQDLRSNESQEAYADRMAMALLVGIQDPLFDLRYEYRLIALLHAQISHQPLKLPLEFSTNPKKYLLAEISRQIENYIEAIWRINRLITKYNLSDLNDIAETVFMPLFTTTFESLHDNFDDIDQLIDSNPEVGLGFTFLLTLFLKCVMIMDDDKGKILLLSYLKIRQSLTIPDKDRELILEFVEDIYKLHSDRNDTNYQSVRHVIGLIIGLQVDEIYNFMENMPDFFCNHARQYLPLLSDVTIEKIMSAARKSVKLFRRLTSAYLNELGNTVGSEQSTNLLNAALTYLLETMPLSSEVKDHYLLLMQLMRKKMQNIIPGQEEVVPSFSKTSYEYYLTLADILLSNEQCTSEIQEELDSCLRLYSVPVEGEYRNLMFAAILIRGANPVTCQPNTIPVALIQTQCFGRLNLLLQYSKEGHVKASLHEGCGDFNLINLALVRGAGKSTIQLMLDCNFPIPKYISGPPELMNDSALMLVNEHALKIREEATSDEPERKLSALDQ